MRSKMEEFNVGSSLSSEQAPKDKPLINPEEYMFYSSVVGTLKRLLDDPKAIPVWNRFRFAFEYRRQNDYLAEQGHSMNVGTTRIEGKLQGVDLEDGSVTAGLIGAFERMTLLPLGVNLDFDHVFKVDSSGWEWPEIMEFVEKHAKPEHSVKVDDQFRNSVAQALDIWLKILKNNSYRDFLDFARTFLVSDFSVEPEKFRDMFTLSRVELERLVVRGLLHYWERVDM